MPAPGMANNPEGVNGLYHREEPYGAIKRLQQSTQAAPIAPTPAVNAPRRAQRAAVNGRTRTAQAQGSTTAPDYQTAIAQVWQQMASMPGASPLVQQYAVRAAQQVGLNGSS